MARISRIKKSITQNQFIFIDWESKFAALHETTLGASKSLEYLQCKPQKTQILWLMIWNLAIPDGVSQGSDQPLCSLLFLRQHLLKKLLSECRCVTGLMVCVAIKQQSSTFISTPY